MDRRREVRVGRSELRAASREREAAEPAEPAVWHDYQSEKSETALGSQVPKMAKSAAKLIVVMRRAKRTGAPGTMRW